MEPDVVSNQPKINKNTFKIGSGDLQEQVANNKKRIRVISTMLKSSMRRGSERLNPKATNIQQSLEQSNLILADIAIQLQQDFQDRKQAERLKLTKNREEQLELRRTNKEQDSLAEYPFTGTPCNDVTWSEVQTSSRNETCI